MIDSSDCEVSPSIFARVRNAAPVLQSSQVVPGAALSFCADLFIAMGQVIAWPGRRPPEPESVVYFVRIGEFIKIGVTTNLKQRVKAFRTGTAENINVLLTVPGDRHLERALHALFNLDRAINELFHDDWLVPAFIKIAKGGNYAAAIEHVESLKRMPVAEHRRILAERSLRHRRSGDIPMAGLIQAFEGNGLKIKDVAVSSDGEVRFAIDDQSHKAQP
jgi:hypothetical protein